MAPTKEKSALKRGRASQGENDTENKKLRRSDRISSQSQTTGASQPTKEQNLQLPTPLTKQETTLSGTSKDGTVTPPEGRPSQIEHRSPFSSPRSGANGLASPPGDTQPFSQALQNPQTFSRDVKDEASEGVWGYLIPLDNKFGDTLVLKERVACPLPKAMKKSRRQHHSKDKYEKQEEDFEDSKISGVAAGGYLIGRHPECDRVLDVPTISNRHALVFKENKRGDVVGIIEDLSGNGTFVNETLVGRNKRRELQDGDEIAVLNEARFIFRYPRTRRSLGFHSQYIIQDQLGKGHFAAVYLAVERSSGVKYAVKKFENRTGPGERSRIEGLQQEIGVLMSVSHPNLLCLKDTFVEKDAIYLVLELAVEGELFNHIVTKSKLSEDESRKVFVQLFQGLKYLHERNIVHRDIKPENVLLVDKDLSVKVADFGLAKIIGEESFTTTLCGTPSYVAPEILESSNQRRYTRAVDVWSLGVVLYICLCGFPPFSDELYTADNPYTLSQQIKLGRFDYPSPYWDPVSDAALDLIDKMLTVDVEKRISIDGCLEHPWTTQAKIDPHDSTDGLTGALGQMDFTHRKPKRERTMLSVLNDVYVSRTIPVPDVGELKVFEKNPSQGGTKPEKNGKTNNKKQQKGENAAEFMQMGGYADQPLFGTDSNSQYHVQSSL